MRDSGPSDTSRSPYGPRSLAALVPDVTRRALVRKPSLGARIAADWSMIVGARLGDCTAPRKLVAGTLTVACSGPVALELQHAADLLIERVNRHLGQAAVERLRLVQAPVGHAAPAAILPPRRPPDRAAIERRLAGVPAGPVRAALAALAATFDSARSAPEMPPSAPRNADPQG